MANYKRKRPRTSVSGNYSNNGLAHRIDDKYPDPKVAKRYKVKGRRYSQLGYPRWWDKVSHTRPTRAKTKSMEKLAHRLLDSEDIVWPLEKKPHKYYW